MTTKKKASKKTAKRSAKKATKSSAKEPVEQAHDAPLKMIHDDQDLVASSFAGNRTAEECQGHTIEERLEFLEDKYKASVEMLMHGQAGVIQAERLKHLAYTFALTITGVYIFYKMLTEPRWQEVCREMVRGTVEELSELE